MTLLAAASTSTATAFIEVGVIVLVLSTLAHVASRFGLTAVPLYLVAGLMFGEGGLASATVSGEFIELTGEIGVLLLLLTLGLEYSASELRTGLRTGIVPGVVDAVLNAAPGFVAGLILGWSVTAALLLAGVTWISSSGVISKVLSDLGRLGYRETSSILSLLVIEDLAMAVYLPLVAALVVGEDAGTTAVTVAVALVAVMIVLWGAGRFGEQLSDRLGRGSNESLLLAVFGLTLVVGGLAERLQVSAAVGAFLVGLAVSGPSRDRAAALMEPLRDLFAAVFFVSFAFQIDPSDLMNAAIPAVLLVIVTAATKIATGWFAAGRAGVGARGRLRAGTTLIARGEFSIVIAAIGVTLADGDELGSLAAAYVLVTALVGPLAAKYADRLPIGRASGTRSVPVT